MTGELITNSASTEVAKVSVRIRQVFRYTQGMNDAEMIKALQAQRNRK